MCGQPATHKVGEEIPALDPSEWDEPGHEIYERPRHNYTAYVCCEHFSLIMGRVVRESFCKLPSDPVQDFPALQQWRCACQKLAQSLHLLAPSIQQFGQAVVNIYEQLQSEYQRAGRPYGDNEDGFNAWCAERAIAERREQESAADWKPLP